MNKYETLFVITPDLDDEATEATINKYTGIIEANGGKVENVDKWGKRRLAYRIQNKTASYQTEGYYVLVNFEGGAELPAELERNFNTDENAELGKIILRSLVVRREA